MLFGINPVLSPDLLKILASMGHGEKILLADAHYPLEHAGGQVLRADGVSLEALVEAVLSVMILDYKYARIKAVVYMHPVPGDEDIGNIARDTYAPLIKQQATLMGYDPEHAETVMYGTSLNRYDFYKFAKENCVCTVISGGTLPYGNVILQKGVTPVAK